MFPVSTDPLSDEEIDWLEAFLLDRIDEDTDTRDLDEGVFCLSELDGLLTAVISGPVMLPLSQWLPQVWGDFEPEFESAEDFQRVMSLMMRHMNNIATLLIEQPQDFEPLFLEGVVEDETHIIVDEWCEGYMRGVALAAGQTRPAQRRSNTQNLKSAATTPAPVAAARNTKSAVCTDNQLFTFF